MLTKIRCKCPPRTFLRRILIKVRAQATISIIKNDHTMKLVPKSIIFNMETLSNKVRILLGSGAKDLRSPQESSAITKAKVVSKSWNKRSIYHKIQIFQIMREIKDREQEKIILNRKILIHKEVIRVQKEMKDKNHQWRWKCLKSFIRTNLSRTRRLQRIEVSQTCIHFW